MTDVQQAIAAYWQRRVDCVPEFDAVVLILGAAILGCIIGRLSKTRRR